jgi:hypothetical protein
VLDRACRDIANAVMTAHDYRWQPWARPGRYARQILRDVRRTGYKRWYDDNPYVEDAWL